MRVLFFFFNFYFYSNLKFLGGYRGGSEKTGISQGIKNLVDKEEFLNILYFFGGEGG